eukprot:TRINITY_DN14923_c0_g1_i2.p1 TRINITY_DN14923_c0_g1~~TRINITY_DN14923_c0_g1_i2.p1  ORF type:complete len:313 (-),score=44.00 TRINITY_DN14923_c0_g1_i2:776-1714(-)
MMMKKRMSLASAAEATAPRYSHNPYGRHELSTSAVVPNPLPSCGRAPKANISAPSEDPPEPDDEPKVPLPPTLRGYAKFVVLVEPSSAPGQPYYDEDDGYETTEGLEVQRKHSVGVRHLLDTSGARKLLRELTNNFFRRHRRHVTAPLCPHFHRARLCSATVAGARQEADCAAGCPAGKECPMIHVTRAGWAERREWFSPSSRDAERANSLEGDLAVEGRSLSEEAESPPSAGSSLGSESPDFKVSAAYTFTTTDTPSTDNESHNAQAKDISGLAEHAWQRYPGVFVRHRNEAKMRSLLRREANSASKPSAI